MRALPPLPAPGPPRGAQAPAPPSSRLDALVQEALAASPELRQARAALDVELTKVPQSRALPDPILALGLFQDPVAPRGSEAPMGRETSLMLSQALPWPGKRYHQEVIATQEAKGAEASLERLRLGLVADLRRAYLGLLLARERLRLLEDQRLLWAQAEGAARVRYEAGQGTQAEWLRAQLEALRLQQGRTTLESEAQTRRTELNRLLGRALDAPLETPERLEDHGEPPPPSFQEALAESEKANPELKAVGYHLVHARHAVDLGHLGFRPDFQLAAGLTTTPGFTRGWRVEVGLSLPLWAATKQRKAVEQWQAEFRMHDQEREALRRLLSQRVRERVDQLVTAQRIVELFRGGLLAQSKATVDSAFVQYEAGRLPLSSLLEHLQGYLADRSGYLEALAQSQALHIALQEHALGPTTPLASGGLGAVPMGAASTPAPKPSRGAGAEGSASPRPNPMSM